MALTNDLRAKLLAIREIADAGLAACDASPAPARAPEPRSAPPVRIDVAPPSPPVPVARRAIAWGARVTSVFRDRVWWIADTLGLDPDDLMSCMAWESGRTFKPDVTNMAGSGATGLIQFMPATARHLGTTTSALARMTAEDQLSYVYKYFRPWSGRLHTLGDVYMAILWPRGVGKPEGYVVFDKGVAYRQNAGLDANRDGDVTKGECCAKLHAMKREGLRSGNVG